MVRLTLDRDWDRMLAVAAIGYAESGLPGPFNRAHFSTWWTRARDLNFAYMLTLDENGKLVGLLNALRAAEMFTGRSQLAIVNWFVLPAFRGRGIELLNECMRYANETKVELVSVGCVMNPLGRRAAQLYVKRGFRLTELTFSLLKE